MLKRLLEKFSFYKTVLGGDGKRYLIKDIEIHRQHPITRNPCNMCLFQTEHYGCEYKSRNKMKIICMDVDYPMNYRLKK